MAAIIIVHRLDQGRIHALLHNPGGPVGRDMLRRGIRVASQARRNLGGRAGRPRRIDFGRLRTSVYVRPVRVSGLPGVQVGADVRYARWVHDGTGLYGPHATLIRPTRGRFLVFTPKGAAGAVFVRSVRGMVANPFLVDALVAARR